MYSNRFHLPDNRMVSDWGTNERLDMPYEIDRSNDSGIMMGRNSSRRSKPTTRAVRFNPMELVDDSKGIAVEYDESEMLHCSFKDKDGVEQSFQVEVFLKELDSDTCMSISDTVSSFQTEFYQDTVSSEFMMNFGKANSHTKRALLESILENNNMQGKVKYFFYKICEAITRKDTVEKSIHMFKEHLTTTEIDELTNFFKDHIVQLTTQVKNLSTQFAIVNVPTTNPTLMALLHYRNQPKASSATLLNQKYAGQLMLSKEAQAVNMANMIYFWKEEVKKMPKNEKTIQPGFHISYYKNNMSDSYPLMLPTGKNFLPSAGSYGYTIDDLDAYYIEVSSMLRA